MEITYNGLSDPSNTISFTGFPCILSIKEKDSGTKAQARITISDLSSVDASKDYTLSINGHKFASTPSPDNGGKFYITSDNSKKPLVAWKLAQLVRASSSIPVNYEVSVETSADGTLSPTVLIRAKGFGAKYDLSVEGTLISSNIASSAITNGTSVSSLGSGRNSKVVVDVYQQDALADKPGSSSYAMGNYVDSLSKAYFGDGIYFDLAPMFTTLAEYGKLSEANLYIYLQNDSGVSLLNVVKDIYFTTGYSVNQGYPFIGKYPSLFLAQNVSRGSAKGSLNNTLLYCYEPNVTFSLYSNASTPSAQLRVTYLDSAYSQIASETRAFPLAYPLSEVSVNLDTEKFGKSFYVDVAVTGVGTLRYSVIKPLKASQECQRAYWTNSYGGTSFFDFTGDRTEQRKTSVDYYQGSLFHYYEGNEELEKVYKKDVQVTVRLSSHNISRDGQWTLFDLQNSSNAWTFVNGKKYSITVTDLRITETSSEGIYSAEVQYNYSLGDTF